MDGKQYRQGQEAGRASPQGRNIGYPVAGQGRPEHDPGWARSLSLIAAQWQQIGGLALATGRLARQVLGTVTPVCHRRRDWKPQAPPRLAAETGESAAGQDCPAAGAAVDHGTLARYAACPFQAWAVETGFVEHHSAAAQAGREVHRVIAEAMRRYVELGLPPAQALEAEIINARPDVQHKAVDGLRRAARAIDRFLTSIHPDDILAYRGGSGPRSGRMSRHVLPATPDRPGVLAASEVDLLYAGASAGEVHEIDFKSGRRVWTATDVSQAFQFRTHCWLLFGRFPRLELHHVRVWNTRANVLTPAVSFSRRDAISAGALVKSAALRREMALAEFGRTCDGAEADGPVGADRRRGDDFYWPELEKCAQCPACLKCLAALAPAKDFAAEPERYLRDTAAMKAALAARMAILRAAVRARDQDLVFGDLAFGVEKPTPRPNPAADFYKPVAAGK